MPDFKFYDEESQALQQVNVVTRDSLGTLAVSILASKVDLAKVTDYDALVRELYDIIKDLHDSYQHLHL